MAFFALENDSTKFTTSKICCPLREASRSANFKTFKLFIASLVSFDRFCLLDAPYLLDADMANVLSRFFYRANSSLEKQYSFLKSLKNKTLPYKFCQNDATNILTEVLTYFEGQIYDSDLCLASKLIKQKLMLLYPVM